MRLPFCVNMLRFANLFEPNDSRLNNGSCWESFSEGCRQRNGCGGFCEKDYGEEVRRQGIIP